MVKGYMGKILFVDLSTGEIIQETPDELLYKDFIGGYGIGARILYSRQKGGVDALGPENTLGFATGPLTSTLVPTGCRYTVMAKSPLTGGWGDANSGGHFAPNLKFAGYDAVFFNGIADKPVYLFIDNGRAELRDASHLWGRDTYETEDILKNELGKNTEIACIGQAGEKLSLISSIVNRKGSFAGRSGLGAVMGSKKLKAMAVRGNQEVPVADIDKLKELRKEHIAKLRIVARPGDMSFLDRFHKYGTSGGGAHSAHSGDTPVKNWGGVGIVDFPEVSGLTGDATIANLESREGCWHCPIACKGKLKTGAGEYNYPAGTSRPQYETQGSFGTMCLNNNTESIAMANHICNSYGLDTISAGCTIAFAIECYENGLITEKDTDGIQLTWGNHRAIIDMTEKMARREGFGDILADGVKVASEKIGKGSEQYAIHIGGQELGMHDPKLVPPYRSQPAAARYQMDATPGRHTQDFGPTGFQGHFYSAAGLCMFSLWTLQDANRYTAGYISAVTGWDYPVTQLLKTGERIANIRHVFNLREGINPLKLKVSPRIIGDPPHKKGPLAGVTIDIKAQIYWNLGALDWSPMTTKPSKNKLLELGLNDVAKELWP